MQYIIIIMYYVMLHSVVQNLLYYKVGMRLEWITFNQVHARCKIIDNIFILYLKTNFFEICIRNSINIYIDKAVINATCLDLIKNDMIKIFHKRRPSKFCYNVATLKNLYKKDSRTLYFLKSFIVLINWDKVVDNLLFFKHEYVEIYVRLKRVWPWLW